jgi:hypothetical protein
MGAIFTHIAAALAINLAIRELNIHPLTALILDHPRNYSTRLRLTGFQYLPGIDQRLTGTSDIRAKQCSNVQPTHRADSPEFAGNTRRPK